MRWKCLILLVMGILWAAMASAALEIEVKPVKNSISLTETAYFDVLVTNNAEVEFSYKIYSMELGWMIDPAPQNRVFDLGSGEAKTVRVAVKPSGEFKPGIYAPTLYIDKYNDNSYFNLKESLQLYINPDQPVEYLPSIKATLDMRKKVNPQEPQVIKLLLENRNPLNISELVIKIQSDLEEFNKETIISLPPLEKKTVEFTIVPDMFQKPGDFFLFFVLERRGEVIKVINQEIEVLPLTPDFQMEISEEKSFLKTTKTILVKNLGNVESTQNITLLVSFWGDLFTKSDARSIKEGDQRYLLWEVTLPPNTVPPEGEITLRATKNYRYPFYFLILVLVFLGLYFYLKSPFSITKTASSLKKDASLSELKVTLHIKNLTKKAIKSIEVIDLIPGIADIEKSLDVGTLKPQEIKHTKKGTSVKWRLAEIESREDRLITYKVKSSLKILGALKLPRAKIFYGAKDKRKTAYSNYFKISSKT